WQRDRNVPVPPARCLSRSRASGSRISRPALSCLPAKQPCPVNTKFPACLAATGRRVPIPRAPRGLFLAATARIPVGKLPRRCQVAVWSQNERPPPLCPIAPRHRIPSRVPDAVRVNPDVAATLLHIPFRLAGTVGSQNSSLPSPG